MKDCKYFDTCSAPLCPLNEKSLEHCVWFPDEEICRKTLGLSWIKRQRKIQKKSTNYEECFTKDMLDHNCMLTIRGLNPDNDLKPQLKKWFEVHKEKKPISPERQKELSDKLKLVRFKKRG